MLTILVIRTRQGIREVKQVAQGNTAGVGQRQDVTQVPLTSDPTSEHLDLHIT